MIILMSSATQGALGGRGQLGGKFGGCNTIGHMLEIVAFFVAPPGTLRDFSFYEYIRIL